MSAIAAFFAAARADIGVSEVPPGSNRGPRIEQMLALCGLGGGYPWCAAAVSQWGTDALGKAWPMPLTADCDVLLDFARRKGILSALPEPGDIFLRLKSPDDANHTGIVTAVNGRAFDTVEGNTNRAGSREGTCVLARSRSLDDGHSYVFARWARLVDTDVDGWTLTVGGSTKLTCVLQGGTNYVPLRSFCGALWLPEEISKYLAWDAETRQPTWRGDALPFLCIQSSQGEAMAPVRGLASWTGLTLKVDSKNKTLEMSR